MSERCEAGDADTKACVNVTQTKSPTVPGRGTGGSAASGHAGDKQLDVSSYRSGITFSGQGRLKDILAWDKAQGMVNIN